jgi:hypothetical protein
MPLALDPLANARLPHWRGPLRRYSLPPARTAPRHRARTNHRRSDGSAGQTYVTTSPSRFFFTLKSVILSPLLMMNQSAPEEPVSMS